MSLRLNDCVIRGEIDNRVRGKVTGRLWLAGVEKPVHLHLEGNCRSDIAGALVTFKNMRPGEAAPLALQSLQVGSAVEITASRRFQRIPDRQPGERLEDYAPRARRARKIANGLHVEWQSLSNGRVLLQGADFQVLVKESAWRMSPPEDVVPDEIVEDPEEDADDLFGEDDDESDDPMDEFEWEQFLREADERAERYVGLMDKYLDHPESEKIIAREMGWDWMDEADAEEAAEEAAGLVEWSADDTLEPDPETEGVDWVRDADGNIEHPLTARLHELTLRMWNRCRENGLTDDPGDSDVHDMLFQLHTATAKLAGALDGVAYEEEPEGGFIVACLKRALVYLHNGIAATSKVASRRTLDPEIMHGFRAALFKVREDALRLMDHYRNGKF